MTTQSHSHCEGITLGMNPRAVPGAEGFRLTSKPHGAMLKQTGGAEHRLQTDLGFERLYSIVKPFDKLRASHLRTSIRPGGLSSLIGQAPRDGQNNTALRIL